MKPLLELEKTLFNVEWKVIKIKRVLDTPITDGPHETPELLDEGIPFLSAESVKKGKLEFNLKRGYISQEDHEKYIKKCKPQRDDIFMIKSGATTGNVAMVETDEEFSIWSPLALIRADKEKILPKYLYYFIGSTAFKEQVEISWSFGTQQNIGMKVIENLFISVPPLSAQEKLVEYMEIKAVQIDKLIEMKEQEISLLEQQRQSIITEAVTKGLNPNVKMKDSGVEWIGEIPEQWEVVKLGWFISIFGSVEITDGQYKAPLFKVNDLNMDKNKLYLNESNEIADNNIKPISGNKILIPKRGAAIFTNKVRVVNVPCYIDSNLMAIVPKKEFRVEYLAYLLWARRLGDIADTSTIPQINNKQINPLKVPLPTIKEQIEIVSSIETHSNQILKLIQSIQLQIEKLKEYRQALIYEAVTGKIDVRDMELD
ncbi:restriction endonuclease subunit S [Lysinibacillus fusiformis]|uniref:restriction endonuclease subunit S n=1 Tax=Lysinibacillus fusiformis TaxID=28031 RepID=UPI002E9B1284|nr:restriction endonuclease subunit S [Lysinibacillus fusiformis]